MSSALDLAIYAVVGAYVSLMPYTKVEESFNLHAIHDVLMYGVGSEALPSYDHFIFPGAVPRTFIGSVIVAWLTQPLLRVGVALGYVTSKFDMQMLARLVLATLNAHALILVRRGVSRRFGRLSGLLFAVLTCTQFHLPFYAGRTLPNAFALIPANIALYILVNRAPNARPKTADVLWAVALLTATAVVFRAEIALLAGAVALQALVRGYAPFSDLVGTVIMVSAAAAGLTVVVDSYFWQREDLLWPEFASLYFNVIEGKSADWGVSPWHTYFTGFLPRMLLSALPLSLVGAATSPRVRTLLAPALGYLALLSALGHKEARFALYAVPIFNVAAARGAAWMFRRPKGTMFGRACFLAVAGLLALQAAATLLFARASMANYPGGAALRAFDALAASEPHVHVHISNLAAQTGASLFLHARAPPYYPGLERAEWWAYDKTEGVSLAELTKDKEVTHVIAEHAEVLAMTTATRTALDDWAVLAVVDGFAGWRVNREALRVRGKGIAEGLRGLAGVLEMVRAPQLVIMKRKA